MATQVLPTKGAVIFGEQDNSLLTNTINNIETEQKRNDLLKQKEVQQLADSWRSNMLKASSGKLWADQIGEIEQAHLNTGQQLVSKGIDPYRSNAPEAIQYRNEQMKIESIQNFRKAMETEYNSLNNVIKKDVDAWDPEDLKKLNEFVSGSKIDEIYQQNAALPTVRKRFDINNTLRGYRAPVKQETVVKDGLETSQSYVDRDEAERGILGRLSDPNNPGAARYLSDLTSGYNVNTLRNLPATKDGIQSLLDGQYDANASLRETLAQQGITSKEDPRYQQYLETESQNLMQAKDKYTQDMDSLISSVSGGITTRSTSKPNYTEQREADRRRGVAQRDTRFNERNSSSSGGSESSGSYNPSAKEYVTYRGRGGTGKAPLYGYTKFNANSVEFLGNNMIDLTTGKKAPDRTSVSGTVVGLGNVPVNKEYGTVVQENYALNNPDKVRWEKRALVEVNEKVGSSAKKKQYLVPASSLPDNMPKGNMYKEFMNSSFSAPAKQSSSAGGTKTETVAERMRRLANSK